MNHQPRRRRARILLVGALVGSVVSLGTMAGTASADKTPPKDESSVVVVVDTPVMSLRSGVRW